MADIILKDEGDYLALKAVTELGRILVGEREYIDASQQNSFAAEAADRGITVEYF